MSFHSKGDVERWAKDIRRTRAIVLGPDDFALPICNLVVISIRQHKGQDNLKNGMAPQGRRHRPTVLQGTCNIISQM